MADIQTNGVPAHVGIEFDEDEIGYQNWRANNPMGFVLNRYETPLLHRLDCHCVQNQPSNGSNWTRAYGKVCATTQESLRQWTNENAGGRLQLCQFCVRAGRLET